MIPPDAQRAMSKRAGATVVEVKGTHAVYVSRPDAVASLITKAAKGGASGGSVAWCMAQRTPRSRSWARTMSCEARRTFDPRWVRRAVVQNVVSYGVVVRFHDSSSR